MKYTLFLILLVLLSIEAKRSFLRNLKEPETTGEGENPSDGGENPPGPPPGGDGDNPPGPPPSGGGDNNYNYTKTAKNYLVNAYNIALDSLQAGQGKSNVNAVKEAAKRELERLQTFMVGNKVITQAEYNSFLKDSIR